MKVVDEKEVLNDFSFWSRAVAISDINGEVTLKDISKKLNDSKSNPYFYKLIKLLEERGFLVVDRSRVPHIYKIKNNELAWFLRNGRLFRFSEILIKRSMGIKPYYYG